MVERYWSEAVRGVVRTRRLRDDARTRTNRMGRPGGHWCKEAWTHETNLPRFEEA